MGILDQYRENKRKRLYDRYQNEKDTGQKLKLLLAILELDGIKINDAKTPKSIANNKKSGIIKVEPFNQDDDLPDGQHWITSKDGHKLLLDKEGVVIAGAGGTLNGLKLSETKSKGTNSNSKTETSSNSSSKKSSESGVAKTAAAKVKKFGGVSVKKFVSALKTAKQNYASKHPKDAWRVASPSQEEFEQEHPNAKCHVTEGGSTIAVAADGDIVSVCKNPGDKMRGKEILALAVENGGTKLDSYDGNHEFYISQGFEPVSWCKWDDEFADKEWVEANGYSADDDSWKSKSNSELTVPREDIIFYKYTGKVTTESAKDFKKRVAASADYGAAKDARNESL